MREIKFRAWDKKEGEMLLDDNLTALSYVDFVKHWDGEYVLLRDIFEDDSLVYMQYTGLKDKNGKEIYEEDILLHRETKKYSEVLFNDGSFWVSNSIFTDVLGKFNTQLLVVGNIYENPDLLRESL